MVVPARMKLKDLKEVNELVERLALLQGLLDGRQASDWACADLKWDERTTTRLVDIFRKPDQAMIRAISVEIGEIRDALAALGVDPTPPPPPASP